MPRSELPLTGARILITRPEQAARSLLSSLRALGADAVARATIDLAAPQDLEPSRAAIRRLEQYEWILFTSAAAARWFHERRVEAGRIDGLPQARLASVGPSTTRELARLGYTIALTATSHRSEGLAADLASEVRPGQRALWACPEGDRSELESQMAGHGLQVDSVPFYRNREAPGAAAVAADIRGDRYDVAIFTSPSSVFRLLESAGADRESTLRSLERLGLIAIGPTTARALEGLLECTVSVAGRPVDSALIPLVQELWSARERRPGCAKIRARTGPEAPQESALAPVDELRRTPLHDRHLAASARMVEFAGWHMPIQYSGIIDEHLAVRRRAGLFDVSHMGEARVVGPQALDLLQYLTCNDVSRLKPGRAHYNALTTVAGTFVDDLLVYQRGADDYLLVLNAANTPKDLDWIGNHAERFDVEVTDVSFEWAQLALQGPCAGQILASMIPQSLENIRYYRFIETEVEGLPCIVSRTGYTGEDGFEIYCPVTVAGTLWDRILESGQPHGAVPVGLAARDTLRLEAKMALYGNDIDITTTVYEADLGWICKLDKGEFIGREALRSQLESGIRRKLVGFELRGRGIARHGHPALHGDREVGRVTSGTHAPYLKKSIGLVYLPIDLTDQGTEFEVELRGRREAAVVVPTPFYRRAR